MSASSDQTTQEVANGRRLRVLLTSLAVLGIVASFGLLFAAGWAGDVKGGTRGVPRRALDLEMIAATVYWPSVTCAAVAGSLLRPWPRGRLVLLSLLILLVGAGVWFVGVWVEAQGSLACSR